jgi:hypothetical protein
MEISLAAPSPSTRKLNSPKAISKPPVPAEVHPIELEMGLTIAVTGESTANAGVVVDAASSMSMAGEALSMADKALSMAMSMADEALSMAIGDADDALSMAMSMVSEGARESVDPDPVVPTDIAN